MNANKILKTSRKTTKIADTRMITFLGTSNLLITIKTYAKKPLTDTYCNTNTNFLLYQSLERLSLLSASSPLVPHDRSSTLQKAKVCTMLMYVGAK